MSPRAAPPRTDLERLDRVAEVFGLRDELLGHVTRSPQLPRDLFAKLRVNYGALEERRLWRALQWLVTRGKVIRVGGHQSTDGGYVRSRDGGTETAVDLLSRKRLELCDEGRCYRCKVRTVCGAHCPKCRRARHATGSRRRAAAQRLKQETSGNNGALLPRSGA